MKFYISKCKSCGNKISLNISASNRAHIRHSYGDNFRVECPNCYNVHKYTPYNVYAESEANSTISGGAIGGAIGLLGGPLGAIIGGVIGGAIGNDQDSQEKNQVERFNKSH